MARMDGWRIDRLGRTDQKTLRAIVHQTLDKAVKKIRDEKGPLAAEQAMLHDAEKFNIKTGVFMFGATALRPEKDVLIQRGVTGLLYLDLGDSTLYKWNGKEWSS